MADILTFGGVPVDESLERGRHALVEQLLDTIVREVALYRDLPADVVQVDVRSIVHENLNAFTDVLRQRSPVSSQLLATVTRSAYRRAEEGIPLAMVISAYLTAAHEAWRLVTSPATADDVESLREVNDLLIGFLAGVLPAVSTAYVEELRSSSTQEQSVRSALLGALLSGDPAEEAAMLAGLELPPQYAVISIHVPRDAAREGAESGQVAISVSQRRRARRIRSVVHEALTADPLTSVDHRGGVVLVPLPAGASLPDLHDLADRLTDAAGPPVLTVGLAAPADVAEVARQTQELVDLVRRIGRRGTVHRLQDLLLEYQLSRPSAASAPLAALL